MRTNIVIACAFAVGLLIGCARTADILEGLGRVHSLGGKWTVELSDSDPGLKIIDRRAGKHPWARSLRRDVGMRVTESVIIPSGWTNHPGAFVYFDEEDRVWAWNGKDATIIYEQHDWGGQSFSISTWPGSIPEDVKMRISNFESLETGAKVSR